MVNYGKVPVPNDPNKNNEKGIELTVLPSMNSFEREPIDEYDREWQEFWIRWETPVLLSSIISIFSIPIVLSWIFFGIHSTGRLWPVWICAIHLQWNVRTSHQQLQQRVQLAYDPDGIYQPGRGLDSLLSTCHCCPMGSIICVDLLLFGFGYPALAWVIIESFFRDVDGTINFDWVGMTSCLKAIVMMGFVVLLLRACVMGQVFWDRYVSRRKSTFRIPFLPDEPCRATELVENRLIPFLQTINWAILLFHILCLLSVLSHFVPWSSSLIPLSASNLDCDPVDTTMCALPFPSFHHMIPDDSTQTGWRVDLKGLAPLRGGSHLHPQFLNRLDGFSTMAPILFYMEGLKEAHEQQQKVSNYQYPFLQGPEKIASSVTSNSITLLLNVDDKTLVHHSAEIDHADPDAPLVLVIPSQPLKHATHYAVAVVNAVDKKGDKLLRTGEFNAILNKRRYKNEVFPSLRQAASWVDDDISSLQLLFDFVTVSEESQLGPVRAVRDGVLQAVQKWDWKNHAEIVAVIKEDECSQPEAWTKVARTIHINLDVPSFLQSRSRYSFLDDKAVQSGVPVSISKAKVMIRVPCSVVYAAHGRENGKPIRSIMEYGHGLFYNRNEVTDGYLSKMANDNGYLLMAMDWRGMSVFDLPVVIKTLVGNPSQFQSVRDNLIQGYGEKLALQHFARNGMLDWLTIDGKKLPTVEDKEPASVFYGVSQGGILGGGYLALAGKTGLIDRGILGSPGTPFASILTRSLQFIAYDVLMLHNLYNNREIRLLLSLIQMAWDSVEVSGLLASPIDQRESLPQILLQAGLGDPIVSTFATEAMARSMNGSVLPSNPRTIFGLTIENPANETSASPKVTLTEVEYEVEYAGLPDDNILPEGNLVHYCVRWDYALKEQVVEFTNTGRIIDPCARDQCIRSSSEKCE